MSTQDEDDDDLDTSKVVDVLRRTYALLTRSEKKKGLYLLIVFSIASTIELAGIGSLAPFLTVLTDPGTVHQNTYLATVYNGLGFTTTRSFLLFLGLVLLVLTIIMSGVAVLSKWLQARYSANITHNLSIRLMASYLRRDYPFFLDRNSSEITKNVLRETRRITTGIVKPAMLLASRGMVTIAILGFLLWFEPVFTALLLGLLAAVFTVVYLLIRRRLKVLGREQTNYNKERYKATIEAFEGIREIKILGGERFAKEAFQGPNKAYEDNSVRYTVYKSAPKHLVQGVTLGGVMALVLVMIALGSPLETIVPIVGTFAFAGFRLLPSFQSMLTSVSDFRYNEHGLDILEDDLKNATDLTDPELPDPLPFQDTIQLEDVCYRYPGSTGTVLEDIDLTIQRREAVAFVGPTGAGKTTLADLISGLLAPSEGALTVDGTEIDRDNVREWQANIGYVPQSIYLRDDSVERNIAYAIGTEDIDQEGIVRAAKAAQIHDFIVNQLPDGYDTNVGERGVRLSGGQRQRIGIARALYRDPEVLLLDEATSDIDNVTQAEILEAIRGLQGEKTLILIAHRLSTVTTCDEIHYVEDGRIVASGSYDELLEKCKPFERMATNEEGSLTPQVGT